MNKDLEKEKELAAKEAVKYIQNNHVVGLGTGSTAYYVIKEVGEMVKNGLQIKAVPTSNKTIELANQYNIPLIDINDIDSIDVTIDGADEFTTDLILIKGGGGALMREKIVASITKNEIIIADSSKKVNQLGKFPLPVEVVPFAAKYVKVMLLKIDGTPKVRMKGDKPFVTDNGNYILDTNFGTIADAIALSDKLNNIEGIVGHGLFIGLAKKIIMGIGETNTTEIFTTKNK